MDENNFLSTPGTCPWGALSVHPRLTLKERNNDEANDDLNQ